MSAVRHGTHPGYYREVIPFESNGAKNRDLFTEASEYYSDSVGYFPGVSCGLAPGKHFSGYISGTSIRSQPGKASGGDLYDLPLDEGLR